MAFPNVLDGAVVLEYSDGGNYGTIEGDPREIRYLAVCRYGGDPGHYLFFCTGSDGGYDVVIDDLFGSVEECRASAARFGDVVWHKK